MPGIVGLVSTLPREQATRELLRMLDTLRHEPFYVTGTWIDEGQGVYLGWTARRRSFSDHMPLGNERGDVVLVFAGEEYAGPATARALAQRGHTLPPDGPSYLVHLYEEDSTFPLGLNGIFHGVVTDRTRGTTTLFNDRFGMHRVYYHEAKNGFYFAAEAKAILAVRPDLRNVDRGSLGELFACGCVLNDRTLFPGIRLLPGGAAWTFRRGCLERKSSYFQPSEWEAQPPLDGASYYAEVRRVFSENLPRYFQGSEPIGMALTGGLDTRAILAWRKPPRQSLPCYTFGSSYRLNRDCRIARKIARECQQAHTVIRAGDAFLARFAHYAERAVYLTDGCVDLSRAPDLFVSEKAREIAPVKIVGTYGSEVLTLAPAFTPSTRVTAVLTPDLADDVRAAGETYAALRQSHPMTFAAFRQSPWWHYGIQALEQTQLTVRAPYLDNDFIRTVYRAPALGGRLRDVRRRLIEDGNPALARFRTDRGAAPASGAVTSAVAGLWPELTFKAEYAFDYAMPQWLARVDHMLAPAGLERLFLGRHKAFHFRVWYRDALAGYVRDILLDTRTLTRPYYRRREVEALVQSHLNGTANHTVEIHKLLTCELLHRIFID